MKNSLRLVTLAVLAVVGLGLISPTAAHASKKGRRNTALALGAVAAYGLIKKKPAIAGIAGAGAVYSWIQSNKVDDDRDRRNNRNRRYNRANAGDRYYDDGYRGGYSNGGYRGYNNGYSRTSYGRSGSYSRGSRYSSGRSYNGRSSRGRSGRRCN